MLRRIILSLAAASLASHAALADPGALAPGKPAGVHQAQAAVPNTMLFVGLGVVVIGAGIYLAKGTYKIPGQSNQTSSPTGTSP
jgi:hypothetical protein